jgi:hypothetical protein
VNIKNEITIFEISFEWINIFQNDFPQKIARKNFFTIYLFLLALRSDKYVKPFYFKKRRISSKFNLRSSLKLLKTLKSNFSN